MAAAVFHGVGEKSQKIGLFGDLSSKQSQLEEFPQLGKHLLNSVAVFFRVILIGSNLNLGQNVRLFMQF